MIQEKEIARPAGGTAGRARMESAKRADTIVHIYNSTMSCKNQMLHFAITNEEELWLQRIGGC